MKPASTGALLLALFGACACGTRQEEPRHKLVRNWVENTVLPLYAELEQNATVLDQVAGPLCAAASAEELETARSAWWQARAPLEEAAVFAFGPYSEEPLRFGPQLDFRPARIDSIREVLEAPAGEALDAETLGAPQKGFPAIEYLLYEPGLEPSVEYAASSRRCAYLLALTSDLVTQSRALGEAWSYDGGRYASELVDAGSGSQTFDSLQMVIGEIVNRMAFTIEAMKNDKLVQAESTLSGRSLEDLRDNLRGVERVFFGTDAEDEISLDEYLKSIGRERTALVRQALDEARAALDAVPEPLTSAVGEYPAQVLAAQTELDELQRVLQVDVLGALSQSVGFSDNDGD